MVYEPKAAEPAVKVPFLVRVKLSDLNIRKGPYPVSTFIRGDYIKIRLIEIVVVSVGRLFFYL